MKQKRKAYLFRVLYIVVLLFGINGLLRSVHNEDKSVPTATPPTPITVQEVVPTAPSPSPPVMVQEFVPTAPSPSPAITVQEVVRNLQVTSPASWDASEAGERKALTIDGVEYAFRWCPPDTFTMGSPTSEQDRDDDESPHQVTLSKGFWMLETEVTQEMWESVMGSNPSRFKWNKRLPVESVSWDDCQGFIKNLNDTLKRAGDVSPRFSLPTEAQWEYACRAGTTTPFHFGSVLNGDKANCNGTKPYGTETKGRSWSSPIEVDAYPVNAWGLFGMHGNVCELCCDWYGDYSIGAVTDPMGPSVGTSRVFRGGSWTAVARGCRSADRSRCVSSNLYDYLGFRLALVSENE